MRKYFTFLNFLFILCSAPAWAQGVSVENVLATAFTDEKVKWENEMARFSNTLNYKLPAIKKIEFRLGFNGNNTPDTLDGSLRNEDYYSINLTTNKWKEMKLQKAIKPVQTKLYTTEMEMLFLKALQERYLLLVNLYYNSESVKTTMELQDLLVKKNELMQQILNEGGSVKISDALEVDRDLIQLYSLLQQEENDASAYQAQLRLFFNSSQNYTVNFSDLISIKKALYNASTLKQDSIIVHPSLRYKEAQYQFAKSNFKLENVQNTNVFNSFQLGYNRPVYTTDILKKFKPENTLTFRVGISVPLAGNNNLNRNNANLEQYDALLNWQTAQVIQSKSISVQESRLENSIQQYKAFEAIYTKSIVTRLLENENVMAQSTALEIIDLKIARKKLEITLINSANTVMQNYVLLLESKGLMQFDSRHKYLLEH